jgi:hypothetical protein
MKLRFSTCLLLTATGYHTLTCNAVRVLLDARSAGERCDWWRGRVRYLAAEMRGTLTQWRAITAENARLCAAA